MRRSFLTPALWIPAGLAIALLVLPLVALIVRAPWVQLPELLSRSEVLPALGLSLAGIAINSGLSVFGRLVLRWRGDT